MGFGRDPAPSLGWQRARSRSLSALPQLAAHALWRSGTDRLRRFALPRAPQPSPVKLSTTTSTAHAPARRLCRPPLVFYRRPVGCGRFQPEYYAALCLFASAAIVATGLLAQARAGHGSYSFAARGAASRPWLMAVELVCRTYTTLLQRAAAGPTHERCEAHPRLRTDIWLQSERPSALSHRYAHIFVEPIGVVVPAWLCRLDTRSMRVRVPRTARR